MTSELGQSRLLKPSVNIIVMTRFLVDLAPFFFEILTYCEIKTTKLGTEKSMKNQNMLLKKDIKTDFYCHLCDIYDFGSSKSYIISCRGLPLNQDFE